MIYLLHWMSSTAGGRCTPLALLLHKQTMSPLDLIYIVDFISHFTVFEIRSIHDVEVDGISLGVLFMLELNIGIFMS